MVLLSEAKFAKSTQYKTLYRRVLDDKTRLTRFSDAPVAHFVKLLHAYSTDSVGLGHSEVRCLALNERTFKARHRRLEEFYTGSCKATGKGAMGP